MKNKLVKNLLLYVAIFVILIAILGTLNIGNSSSTEVGLATLVEKINNEEVKKITVKGDTIDAILQDDSLVTSRKEASESFTTVLKNLDVQSDKLSNIDISIAEDSGATVFLTTILPFLLPLLIIGALFWFLMRQVQGANNRAMMFGQSQARQNTSTTKNRVTFDDVAGAIEAKEELVEVVDFLKNPEKFIELGAKIPKGVLLLGPPGTGKTLLARAVAGEANAPFFHMSGSEFVEMFVGVGASRVRDLFKKAKKASPCIVFIDEIDAVGRQRGAGLGGSHDEREQTLNQILVEMDGFDNQTNVIVMAATNRPDVLDPALLRPGRFDRQVIIDMPDIKDREAILGIHARKKPLAEDVKITVVAQRTPGFSGADLENVLNEAAIATARKSEKKITQQTILDSIEKVMLGPARKSRVITEKERQITAYHEAGHALIAHLLPNADPVHKVSIISRGRAGGYTLKLPTEDRSLHSRSEFIDDMAVMLGGYSAEKVVFSEITTGASSDLQKATSLARQLIMQFGMSEKLGPRTFGKKDELVFLGKEIHERRDYSEDVAKAIDEEVSSYIKEAFVTATKLIKENKPKLEAIANKLLEKETLEREEFEAVMAAS